MVLRHAECNQEVNQVTIKKILVPLDGSENAEKIGGWIAGLAEPLGAEVALVTVVDPDKIELPESTAEHGHPIPGRPGQYDRPGIERTGAMGATGMVGGMAITPGHGGGVEHAPAFGTQILDSVMEQASQYLEREADRMNAAGVKSSFKALMGDPSEVIVDHAREIKADLIAMATHRGSGLARGILGSVTDRVLRSAGMPVMAVHPESLNAFSGTNGHPQTVLVPLDGSERSASIVDLALDIAKAVSAEVVFFRVVQYPYYGVTAIDASYYHTDYGISFQRQEAEAYLEPFKEKAKAMGLKARSLVVTGSPASRLLDEAKSLNRPLIVMSTRGASGIKRWVLGSVADKVVRSSGLPVLVVPPPEKD
jgi:nucleotide-binding universal stress UspA family protein